MTTGTPETARRTPETATPQAELGEREKRSQDYVESVEERNKRLLAMRSKNKGTLFDKWIQNKDAAEKKGTAEKKETSDDPKFLALRDIPESLGVVKTEAAGLLHMYEKFLGTRQQAMELYKNCWKNNKFDIDVLRKEFSREKTAGKTGFYFGTRKVEWDYDWKSGRGTIKNGIKKAGFDSEHVDLKDKAFATNAKLINITGWWAHDVNEDEPQGADLKGPKLRIKGGKDFVKDVLKKLKGGGYGDEFLGRTFKDAMTNLKDELKAETDTGERDSGLSPRQEGEVLKASLEAQKLHTGVVYKDKEKEELYKYFSTQVQNKWFVLSDDKIGSMDFVYGAGGNSPKDYMYRYSPDKKRIYFIRIDGRNVSDLKFGGYIDVDEKAKTKTLKEWQVLNKNDAEKEFKGLIDSMKDADMVKELMDYGQKIEGVSMLDRTRGMVAATAAFKKGVAYNKFDSDFYDVVRKDLDVKLEKQGITTKEERDKYVEPRIDDLKKQLDKLIAENSLIQSAIKEKQDVKISINIADDIVSVDLADIADKTKHRGALDAARAAKDSVESRAKDLYGQFEEKVKKTFKGASGVMMMVFSKFFKITPESIKDYLAGGKDKAFSTTGLVLGALGLSKGAGVFGGSKLDQKSMDEAIKSGKSDKVLAKETIFTEDVKLTNKKIIIPKGHGIQPGGKMKVKRDGSDQDIDKKEEKQENSQEKVKKGLFGMFGGGAHKEEENLQLKDYEIVIENGTTIPKDTVIPKGAKIVKV